MRYMIAAPMSEEFYSRYACVCHPVRGGGVSTRPQVVNADNSWEARLLKAIGERTGFAGVLNTSFNLHGEPIVETPEDALISFKTAAIPESLLFLEDKLLSINAVTAAAIPTLKLPHAKSVPRRRREACVCVVSPDGQYAVPQVRDDILSFGYAITKGIHNSAITGCLREVRAFGYQRCRQRSHIRRVVPYDVSSRQSRHRGDADLGKQ